MARLILDTGVLIAGIRGQLDMAVLGADDDVAIPAIVVAEYLAGTPLDPHPGRAAAAHAFLEDLLSAVPVHDYDTEVARHHAALLAEVRHTGYPRGAHDLIVAATARATGRTVLTTDERAQFADLPGVTARVLPAS